MKENRTNIYNLTALILYKITRCPFASECFLLEFLSPFQANHLVDFQIFFYSLWDVCATLHLQSASISFVPFALRKVGLASFMSVFIHQTLTNHNVTDFFWECTKLYKLEMECHIYDFDGSNPLASFAADTASWNLARWNLVGTQTFTRRCTAGLSFFTTHINLPNSLIFWLTDLCICHVHGGHTWFLHIYICECLTAPY